MGSVPGARNFNAVRLQHLWFGREHPSVSAGHKLYPNILRGRRRKSHRLEHVRHSSDVPGKLDIRMAQIRRRMVYMLEMLTVKNGCSGPIA
jgi:hypothetical protein